jgi:hypothetical protein
MKAEVARLGLDSEHDAICDVNENPIAAGNTILIPAKVWLFPLSNLTFNVCGVRSRIERNNYITLGINLRSVKLN